MILVHAQYKKLKILRMNIYWFSDQENEHRYHTQDTSRNPNSDIDVFHNMAKPLSNKKNILRRNATTLITDLSIPEEEVFSKIKYETRRQIRYAKREGISSYYFDSEYIKNNSSLFNEYVRIYNEFIKSKKLSSHEKCNVPILKAYLDAGILIITCAKYKEEIVVFHSYIVDGKTARQLHSVSLFRNVNDNKMRDLLGRANRMLHWDDIMTFKNQGYKIYDWGGYSNQASLQGINEFKKQFGGTQTPIYHYSVPQSLFGNLVIYLIKIKEALHR